MSRIFWLSCGAYRFVFGFAVAPGIHYVVQSCLEEYHVVLVSTCCVCMYICFSVSVSLCLHVCVFHDVLNYLILGSCLSPPRSLRRLPGFVPRMRGTCMLL